jgi:hypothetical protein
MENKNTAAAQAAAGAKTPQPTKATTSVAEKAQATKPATTAVQAPAPQPAAQKAPSIEELVEKRAEQVRRQAEIVGHREILLQTQEELGSIKATLSDDIKAGAFNTKKAKLIIEVEGNFRAAESVHITNPALIANFSGYLCREIDKRVEELERELMA